MTNAALSNSKTKKLILVAAEKAWQEDNTYVVMSNSNTIQKPSYWAYKQTNPHHICNDTTGKVAVDCFGRGICVSGGGLEKKKEWNVN